MDQKPPDEKQLLYSNIFVITFSRLTNLYIFPTECTIQ